MILSRRLPKYLKTQSHDPCSLIRSELRCPRIDEMHPSQSCSAHAARTQHISKRAQSGWADFVVQTAKAISPIPPSATSAAEKYFMRGCYLLSVHNYADVLKIDDSRARPFGERLFSRALSALRRDSFALALASSIACLTFLRRLGFILRSSGARPLVSGSIASLSAPCAFAFGAL